MTNGERLVWASAYVLRFADVVRDPMFGFICRDKSERKVKQAVRQVALKAVDFADMAVDSLHLAKKDMVRKKIQKADIKKMFEGTAYKRLTDILYGRY
jgi:hypothetical protein